ncbi:MAG: serine protease, partial [Rhodothermales bacterium]|nr:serine protease [Rhodothermales bacterium]
AAVVAEDRELDVAVLAVASAPVPTPLPELDRVANLEALRRGQGVWAVGCGGETCYEIDDGDRILALGAEIVFSTDLVRGGSSGGGLFDRAWELVGMVLQVSGGRSRALPVDQLLSWAESEGVPVALRPPAVPRSGYRTTVGVTAFPFGRTTGRSSMPAARVTLRRETGGPLAWHAGLARLTDRDVAAAGVLGGVSLGWTPAATGRRLRLSLLGEVGLANVQGRFDRGGVFVEGPAGGRYRPAWVPVDGSGLGFGVAGGVGWTAAPRLVLEVLAGFWSFEVPVGAPELSGLRAGVGLRFGFL